MLKEARTGFLSAPNSTRAGVFRGPFAASRIAACAALVAVCAFASACAHTLIIETEPIGARIFVEGEDLGQSPVLTAQRLTAVGRLHVRAEAEGFDSETVVVMPNGWMPWRYPEHVLIPLRPRFLGGMPLPSDTWRVPLDYDPNPPPITTTPPRKPPPQPEGGNPLP